MNKIAWIGDRFECNSPELEEAKWRAIHSRKGLSDFMKACDLPVWNYVIHLDRSIVIYKPLPDGGLTSFEIAEEGTGFNICFHLGAYAIASMNLGQKLEICAYSFKPLLHAVLFQGLSKWFSDRPAQEIDKNCSYYSGDSTLKCAVNPSLPCKDCSDVSAGFNENLFVWSDEDLRWMSAPPIPRSWIESSEFNVERVTNRSISIGISGDTSRVQEAIARLRSAGIPERPFTEGFVGVDMGSGEDATAIATGFTAEDGAIRIDSLEIRNLPPMVEAAIANIRAKAGEILDHNFREAYQCGG